MTPHHVPCIWALCLVGLACSRTATTATANEVVHRAPAQTQGGQRHGADAIDQIFADYTGTNVPGCALGVLDHGSVVLRRAYGMANLEHSIPLTTDSRFRIASLSKQFTAAAVAILEEQGEISIKDRIDRFFPGLPEAGRIRVVDLIHQTSGIRDHFNLMVLSGFSEAEIDYSTAELIGLLGRQRGLNFTPGTRFEYSNSNYVLLAEIVQQVTSTSLRAFTKSHIFEPLGMDHSVFNDERDMLIPGRADGYAPRAKGQGFRSYRSPLEVVGDGGMFTSVEDMLRWQATFDPPVGTSTPGWLSQRTKVTNLSDGTPNAYAYGLIVGEHRGQPMVWHDGQFVGFRSAALRLPESQLSVVCLCNSSTADARGMAIAVADVWLDSAPTVAPIRRAASGEETNNEEPRTIKLSTEVLQAYAGRYTLGPGHLIEIRLEQGTLVAIGGSGNRHPLFAQSSQIFYAPSEGLTFKFEARDQDAGDPSVVLTLSTSDSTVLAKSRKASTHATPPADLKDLLGRYHSEELATDYLLTSKADQLYLEVRQREPVLLEQIEADRFTDGWRELHFQHDRGRRITGFVLQAGSIQGLRFQRTAIR